MRSNRWRLGLILPAALVLLVATLAALQYRWLGQVSDAERDAMRTNLQRRAAQFADDFDREITLAYSSFSSLSEGLTIDNAAPAAAGLARWKENARFPEIVHAVYFATMTKDGPALRRFVADRTAFDSIDWPESLAAIKPAIWPELKLPLPAGGRTSFVTLGSTQVVVDPPALIIGIVDRERIEMLAHDSSGNAVPNSTTLVREIDRRNLAPDVLFSMSVGREFLVIELDRQVLNERMLATLAEQHFGTDQYRVSIIDNKEQPLLTYPSGAPIESAEADVALPFFTVRTANVRMSADGRLMTWTSGAQFVGRGTTAPPIIANGTSVAVPRESLPNRFSVVVEGGRGGAGPAPTSSARAGTFAASTVAALKTPRNWQVLLQHSAGSLNKAVAQARARNLWLSFGILSVLMAGVGLIVLNARRSERLAAQQMDFVATVSHELRTPLAVIRSAAQNLSAGVVLDATQAQRYGDLIEAEGRRLTDMVEQVLEYAGLSGNRQSVRMRAIDLGAVVHDVMSTSVALLDDDEFIVAVDIDSDVPLVLADEGAIRRAITNLVTNAIKYGGDGRWMGVMLRHVTVRGKSEVQLAVQDKGRGIEPEDLPHIFEAFYRGRYAVERQIHGNGLGLSLVKRIVDAHGGKITVQSVRGEGSTFTLHLPAAIADAAHHPLSEPAHTT